MGTELPDQYAAHRRGPQPRQPRLGWPRQHLFLGRYHAKDRRRHSDAAAAIFRQDRARPIRNVRAWRLRQLGYDKGCGLKQRSRRGAWEMGFLPLPGAGRCITLSAIGAATPAPTVRLSARY
jgi:hypothetical protein